MFGIAYLALSIYNLLDMTMKFLEYGVELEIGAFFRSYFTQLLGLIFTVSLINLAYRLRQLEPT